MYISDENKSVSLNNSSVEEYLLIVQPASLNKTCYLIKVQSLKQVCIYDGKDKC